MSLPGGMFRRGLAPPPPCTGPVGLTVWWRAGGEEGGDEQGGEGEEEGDEEDDDEEEGEHEESKKGDLC